MLELVLLLELHGPDNQVIVVNPQEIVSIREPKESGGHVPKGTKCIVNTSDGKFMAVAETCQSIERRVRDAK